MKKISINMNNILIKGGFVKSGSVKNMYFTRNDGDIKQIFLPSFIRKMGSVRFDGYIGLYFLEFERKWKESKKENPFYRVASPSFGISISNFLDLSDYGVFHYTTSELELIISAKSVYDKCVSLPITVPEFTNCVKTGKMLGRNISDYINIYENSYENNPRLIKLANLLRWLERKCELFSELDSLMLDRYQIAAIRRIPQEYYYVN